MKRYKQLLIALGLVTGMVGVVAPSATVSAAPCTGSAVHCATQGVNDSGGRQNKTSVPTFVKRIVNLLLYVLGAVAVIVIVIGGIRYATSSGDQSQLTGAKNTILYAVVGLVVAIMAYAIVNFVLLSFK